MGDLDPSGCERCGRVECDVRAAESDPRRYDYGRHAARGNKARDRIHDAKDDCDRHRVDWRALYFAAPTSPAPSPLTEAEIDLLIDAVDFWIFAARGDTSGSMTSLENHGRIPDAERLLASLRARPVEPLTECDRRAWDALDALYENKGQGRAREQHTDLAKAIDAIREYIAREDEAPCDDSAPQDVDEAHRILSAAGIADGELSERVQDAIDEWGKEVDALHEAIVEHLPEYQFDDGSGDLASHAERIEYAGREIKRLTKGNADLTDALADARALLGVARASDEAQRARIAELESLVAAAKEVSDLRSAGFAYGSDPLGEAAIARLDAVASVLPAPAGEQGGGGR